MTLADALTRAGEWCRRGNGFRIRCPAHRGEDFNCAVWEEDGRARFKCWSGGCDPSAIIAALEGRPQRKNNPDLASASPGAAFTGVERIRYARAIWRDGRPIRRTPAESYLRRRGILLELGLDLARFSILKYPETRNYLPALIFPIRDIRSDVTAIQRVFLTTTGDKACGKNSKLSLGVVRGAAIRFGEPNAALAVGEGPETMLSVRQAMPELACWAVTGADFIKSLELPAFVREVVICADADDPGVNAARQAASRFLREGRHVRIAKPHGVKDFNDRLRA